MEEAKKRLCHNRAGFFEVAVSEMGAWALKKCTLLSMVNLARK